MKKYLIVFGLSLFSLLFFFNETASAQSKQRVSFARGASSATVSGTIKGYEYKDYIVGAREGQTMTVRLTGSTRANFAIMMPDGGNLGMDATGVTEWTGELPASGNYAIRVLMPRAFARRKGASANFTVRISIR